MKSNTLTLHELVVARDGAVLTAPISMVLTAGEMLAIHGSNGSGKSTLLKILAGLIRPHTGSFTYADADGPLHIRPTYIGHKRGLTDSLSVYDNVAFWANLSGHPELVAAAMRYFDLTDIPNMPVGQLSAGWQQRVSLTRLITMPSPLWLLDEPTNNLDSEGIALLQTLIESRLEQGGSVLVATHMQMQGKGVRTLNFNNLNKNLKVSL